VTADLSRRTWQHKHGGGSAFAREYGAIRLVHAEHFEQIEEAIAREKAIKKWLRDWKIELIERENPDWLDLSEHLIGA
jgi:putative endonuclease